MQRECVCVCVGVGVCVCVLDNFYNIRDISSNLL